MMARLTPGNRQLIALVVLLVVVAAGFTIASPTFLSPGNVVNILVQAAPTIIAAVGMTFVLAAGWIDLSVGSVLYLSVVFALVASGTSSGINGASSVWTYFMALGLALGLGGGTPLLIQLFRVYPLLITLGTLTLYRGIGLRMTDSGNLAADGPIQAIGRGSVAGIPLPLIIAVAVVVLGILVLRYTRYGRYVLAIGGAPRSAMETGLPVNRVRLLVFAGSALCAAVAGLIIAGRTGTAQTSLGDGFEFTVITAVIVGGTSLFGGRGSVLGSALGALLLSLISNGLNRIDASIYVYDVAVGIVLFAAVLTDAVASGRLRPSRLRVSRNREKQPQSMPVP